MTTLRIALSRTAPVVATLGALLLSGCAPTPPSDNGSGCALAGTPLAELDLVADPKTHVGESTACMEDTGVEPVASDLQPKLPATIVDNQGTEVTVADARRILALDIYGSLAATVFGLGLGDSVVGRDTSTGFDGAVDLPLVTQNGHEFNGAG